MPASAASPLRHNAHLKPKLAVKPEGSDRASPLSTLSPSGIVGSPQSFYSTGTAESLATDAQEAATTPDAFSFDEQDWSSFWPSLFPDFVNDTSHLDLNSSYAPEIAHGIPGLEPFDVRDLSGFNLEVLHDQTGQEPSGALIADPGARLVPQDFSQYPSGQL
ncbi:unnamed protein product [Parascedosporium putredinis]|uniref:Uncharacterized protein n=1 Tax=Parascedosporium putredinis TaxID=1442378 RepID=A0A9P1MCY3_9PEZI|nr:unnamed protein product [Parascedosporium putredinis]CAI8001525.1 unnamed protein product [Parascedosporium putredinis]